MATNTRLISNLSTLAWYAFVLALLTVGWQVRDDRLLVAGEGVGYWLGLIGASMMLLLLSYPLRKKLRAMQGLGAIRHWFRVHMFLGVAGPVLILFHSNFSAGSINSSVALFCTIVVASSGVLGRYFYSRIHHGLYGRRATYGELRDNVLRAQSATSAGIDLPPAVGESIAALERIALGTPDRLGPVFVTALTIGWQGRRTRARIRRELRQAGLSAGDRDHVLAHIRPRLSLLRKFAQFRAFERLFALWHVLHYPLFLVLVVAAIVHVLAVHAY
ncbi:MAG: transcriptional regulator [Pseudomonadales bacterium]|nr:transcriptional regulator [Pseudomonadales bacterium]MCP5185566.1 transcriptional regulator [Pseudomonadales bacterium]